MSDPRTWFQRKPVGIGWIPRTWEGWAIVAAIIAVGAFVGRFNPRPSDGLTPIIARIVQADIGSANGQVR